MSPRPTPSVTAITRAYPNAIPVSATCDQNVTLPVIILTEYANVSPGHVKATSPATRWLACHTSLQGQTFPGKSPGVHPAQTDELLAVRFVAEGKCL